MLASWPEILRQGNFGRGRTLVVWTMGQGGSLGLVDALLRLMEPRVVLTFSIWSGEGADVRQVEEWVRRSKLVSARWIVDRSFEGRDQDLARILRRRFGKGCIFPSRVHAKCIALTAPGWRIAAVTSASLDRASRLEHWVISDDTAFAATMARNSTNTAITSNLLLQETAPVHRALPRLLGACVAQVERRAPDAPEAVKDEATIRLAAWLYESPAHSASRGTATAFRSSGAAAALSPWARRPAVSAG